MVKMKILPDSTEQLIGPGEVEQIYYETADGTRSSYTFPFGVSYFCAKYNLEVLWVDSDEELLGWNEADGWEYATYEVPATTTDGTVTVIGKKKV